MVDQSEDDVAPSTKEYINYSGKKFVKNIMLPTGNNTRSNNKSEQTSGPNCHGKWTNKKSKHFGI